MTAQDLTESLSGQSTGRRRAGPACSRPQRAVSHTSSAWRPPPCGRQRVVGLPRQSAPVGSLPLALPLRGAGRGSSRFARDSGDGPRPADHVAGAWGARVGRRCASMHSLGMVWSRCSKGGAGAGARRDLGKEVICSLAREEASWLAMTSLGARDRLDACEALKAKLSARSDPPQWGGLCPGGAGAGRQRWQGLSAGPVGCASGGAGGPGTTLRSCLPCSDEKQLASVAEQVASVFRRGRARPRGTLSVTSIPTAAQLAASGRAVGTTPWKG